MRTPENDASTLEIAQELEDLLGTLQRRYTEDIEVSSALIEAQRLVDSLQHQQSQMHMYVESPIWGPMEMASAS